MAGKAFRKGISFVDLMDMFPDDATAEQWFIEHRWPNGVACAHCGSLAVSRLDSHPTMPFRCRDCRKYFSVKTNGLMHSSKLGYRKWAIAIYIVTTNIKGTSSMKLHRDLGITQKTAWHMAHRIRETYNDHHAPFTGPVEVDETYIGGLERNKHESRKQHAGRGPIGKTPVVGMKDRDTGKVTATPVDHTDRKTLQDFVEANTEQDTTVYTDDAAAYKGIPRPHESVKHSVKEYVHGQAHTNGVESFWAMLKRGYVGTYHHMSVDHLHRYVNEFAGRHNDRPADTRDQMRHIVEGMNGKRLRYNDLIAA